MYLKHRLSNGIRVFTQELSVYRSASIGIWVKTGSNDESRENNGLSHFIEHMIFKGTDSYDAKYIAEFFDGIGGDMNAFTSKECTCYHAKVLDHHLLDSIEIMGKMLSNPLMDPKEIEKEKGVVLDEIYMAEDTPDDVSYDLIGKTTYGDGPLGYPILGSRENVENFSKDMIETFMNSNYTTDNIVVSIAGSFDEKAVLEALNNFLVLPSKTVEYQQKSNTFRPNSDFINKDIEQVHLEIAFEGIPYNSKDIFDLAAANAMFGSSVSSRLFQNIRENHGLTYSINSFVTQYEAVGLLNIYASMNTENLKKVVDLISLEIKNIITDGFTENELNRVKEQLKGNYILDLEGSDSFMNLIGRGELFNKPVYSIAEIEKNISLITLESVNQVIGKILSKTPAFTLVGRVEEDDFTYSKRQLQGDS